MSDHMLVIAAINHLGRELKKRFDEMEERLFCMEKKLDELSEDVNRRKR